MNNVSTTASTNKLTAAVTAAIQRKHIYLAFKPMGR